MYLISKVWRPISRIMKIKTILATLVFTVSPIFVTSCATGPTKTPLELQAIQKKTFEASKSVAFASVMSVFQDLGYIIKSADKDTGLIQASSPTKNVVLFGSHMSNTEASAFVEQLNSTKTSIRLNFVAVSESSSGYGMKSKSDRPVETPETYQNAFNKIQEAIFIRKQ